MAKAKNRLRNGKEPVDILPPHSEEMERGVLGCVLIAPACLGECIERFNHRSDAFYDLRHQLIFGALMTMRRAGDAIEVATVQQHLKDAGELDAIGIGYLSQIANDTPSAANITYYIDSVCEKFELRKIQTICTEIGNQVHGFEGSAEAFIANARRKLHSVGEINTRGKCEIFSISDLDSFDLDNDGANLVGNRYLTQGSSLLINGPSGRGKSSLLMLRLILWALGRPFYGMAPVRPLSSIIWQTENNKGDLAKAFQGVRNFLKLHDEFERDDIFATLKKNIEFVYCPALCGREFLEFAELELTKHPRDLAVLDPLVSFPEGDLNGAQGAGEFIRKGIFRIGFLTNTTWIVNHHTPKPLRDPRNTKAVKKVSDYQYGGAGSFDIPGAFRAVETLEESEDGVFRLVLAKRGTESGATHSDGTPTVMLWLKHATEGGIHWEQIEPPSEPEESREVKEKRLTKPQIIATANLGTFLSQCPKDGETLRGLIRRLLTWLGSKESPQKSLATTSHGSMVKAVGLMLDNEKLELTDELYFKGRQA